MARAPLNTMRFRTQGLASAVQATYGTKEEIRRHNQGQLHGHQGWDLEAPELTPCYAVEDGIVADVGSHHDFGNYVNLQFSHKSPTTNMSRSNDTYFAFYAHLTSAVVLPGSIVRAGQLVGYTGRTGNASGGAPHLHFEIHTVSTSSPGKGLTGRVDPGAILGYHHYQSTGTATAPATHNHPVPQHHPVHRAVRHPHSKRRPAPPVPIPPKS